MVTEVNNKSQSMSLIESQNKTKFLYPGLILLIWLIAYILCTVFWEQKIGWDENSYLTCAKGIALDNDFSSRTTTVLGLLKYSFPQHTHHYPLYSAYVALFFKLFGVSIKVAYFSTWLAGLVTCMFIYLTMLVMTGGNRFFSFATGITFLFLPRILDYCDSAMMEIPGCALISIFTYFIFKDLSKGKLNPVLLAISGLWLLFYKSLFIGALIGLFLLIVIAYKIKPFSIKLDTKIPFWGSILAFSSVFSALYFAFTKFIFLPLAPMMNFDRRTEDLEIYADFLAGFLNDPISNGIRNLSGSFDNVIRHYLPYFPVVLIPNYEGLFNSSPSWCEFGLFNLILIYVIAFFFISWKKFLPVHKAYIFYTIVSIFALNLIFNLIATSVIGVRCRYNLLYVPLLLVSAATITWVNRNYFLPFVNEHKKGSIIISLIFILLVYFPYSYASLIVSGWNKELYHNIAHTNMEIVRRFIGENRPMSIYFHAGQHTNWDLYPTRVVLMEMRTEQLRQINEKLPKPIEYLFLQPSNTLFKENQDLIMKGQPIVDNWYTFLGVDQENKIIVYKLNPDIGAKVND